MHPGWRYMIRDCYSLSYIFYCSRMKKACAHNGERVLVRVTSFDSVGGNRFGRKRNYYHLHSRALSCQKCIWIRHIFKIELNYQEFFSKSKQLIEISDSEGVPDIFSQRVLIAARCKCKHWNDVLREAQQKCPWSECADILHISVCDSI